MGRFGTIDGILEPSPAGVEEFKPPSCVARGHTLGCPGPVPAGRECSALYLV